MSVVIDRPLAHQSVLMVPSHDISSTIQHSSTEHGSQPESIQDNSVQQYRTGFLARTYVVQYSTIIQNMILSQVISSTIQYSSTWNMVPSQLNYSTIQYQQYTTWFLVKMYPVQYSAVVLDMVSSQDISRTIKYNSTEQGSQLGYIQYKTVQQYGTRDMVHSQDISSKVE